MLGAWEARQAGGRGAPARPLSRPSRRAGETSRARRARCSGGPFFGVRASLGQRRMAYQAPQPRRARRSGRPLTPWAQGDGSRCDGAPGRGRRAAVSRRESGRCVGTSPSSLRGDARRAAMQRVLLDTARTVGQAGRHALRMSDRRSIDRVVASTTSTWPGCSGWRGPPSRQKKWPQARESRPADSAVATPRIFLVARDVPERARSRGGPRPAAYASSHRRAVLGDTTLRASTGPAWTK
jgi:hypothetical protein